MRGPVFGRFRKRELLSLVYGNHKMGYMAGQ